MAEHPRGAAEATWGDWLCKRPPSRICFLRAGWLMNAAVDTLFDYLESEPELARVTANAIQVGVGRVYSRGGTPALVVPLIGDKEAHPFPAQ
jgi:hypothetical protein